MEMEKWHVTIESAVWRINSIITEHGPHELVAFGHAYDRVDALQNIAKAFTDIASSTSPTVPTA